MNQKENLGFAAAANTGMRAARSEWVAVLNNDTEAAPGWLAECVAATQRYPEAAFLACRILDFAARDRLYSAGDCFLRAGIGYRRGHGIADCPDYREDREVFSACGCAAVYRKAVFEKAGGYEEDFFAYLEDVDLGFRLRAAGHRGYYVAAAEVYHHGGGTSGGEFSSLSVRLRTRNSLLLLLKNYPARFLWRCSPMILSLQLSWLARTVAHGKTLSYLRGLMGALRMLPAALRARRASGQMMRDAADALWRAVVLSEDTARRDFTRHAGSGASAFLHWYFRLF
jgi:GT2 family glycosyltransferase